VAPAIGRVQSSSGTRHRRGSCETKARVRPRVAMTVSGGLAGRDAIHLLMQGALTAGRAPPARPKARRRRRPVHPGSDKVLVLG
jgi:hypothetical protein